MFTIVKTKDVLTNEGETKILFFAIICGLNVSIWIRTKVEHRSRFLKNLRILDSWNSKRSIYNTHSVLGIPRMSIVPNQSLKLQIKPIKPPYNDYNVIIFPINFQSYFFIFYCLFAFSVSSLSTCIWYTFNVILHSYYLNKIFVFSHPILLIHVLNCFVQYYHLSLIFPKLWQINHWLLASYHSQFNAWLKRIVVFNFEHNFWANRMTMTNFSRW